MIKYPPLGGTVIAVAEWSVGICMGLRIACRPAIRPEVADIKKIARANGASWIADISCTDVGVSLPFQKYDISTAPLFVAGEQSKQAAASHFRQRFEAGGFQKAGRKVHEIDEVITDLAGLDFGGPPDRQRLSCATIVKV